MHFFVFFYSLRLQKTSGIVILYQCILILSIKYLTRNETNVLKNCKKSKMFGLFLFCSKKTPGYESWIQNSDAWIWNLGTDPHQDFCRSEAQFKVAHCFFGGVILIVNTEFTCFLVGVQTDSTFTKCLLGAGDYLDKSEVPYVSSSAVFSDSDPEAHAPLLIRPSWIRIRILFHERKI